jgi:DNA invertase Pin-like site-specific DNA recombinase
MTTRAKRAKQPTSRRFIGYIRISKKRDDETSTTTQQQRMEAWCTAHGHTLADLVIEKGVSAFKQKRASRPGYRQVEQKLRAGVGDGLLVWKMDRACRNTEDTLELVRDLDDRGLAFASVTEPFDTTTSTGRLIMTVLAALAEMESATKSERVQVWQDQRLEKLLTPTGPRPYGYRREKNQLLIDEHEAAAIKLAASAVLAHKSLGQIIRDLTDAGYMKDEDEGRPFNRRGLRAVLTNPTIAGLRRVDGGFVASSMWEPILDRDTWDDVQKVLLDPARHSGPGNARRWLLSGIARCGRPGCGAGMMAKSHKAGPRYSCPVCHLSIEAARTDEVVVGDVLDLLDPATWRQLRAGRPSPAAVDDTGYDDAMTGLVEQFNAGDIDAVELAAEADKLRRLRDEALVTELPPELPDVDDVRKAWPKMSLAQRRLVVAGATASLTIAPWKPGTVGYDDSRVSFVPV